MQEKVFVIGVFGHKEKFEPWLMGVDPIEVYNGELIGAHQSTVNIFHSMPFEMRINPVKNQWMSTDMKDSTESVDGNGYKTAMYFSNDYQHIYNVLLGMKFTFDVTFGPGIHLKKIAEKFGVI
jgi:hypothetical protein